MPHYRSPEIIDAARSMTEARLTRGTRTLRLPLLPSGPDGVGRATAARDQTINAIKTEHDNIRGDLKVGIRSRWSGLRVTGHRYLPI